MRLAQETTRNLGTLVTTAVEKGDADLADELVAFWRKSETQFMQTAMIMTIRPHIAVNVGDFDSNTTLLGVRNGIIDLNDHSFRPAERDDLMTKQCNASYDPDAQCPIWLKFLDETTAGDVELQRYLQQCAGLSLIGQTREHLFFIVTGKAGTGKTTFQETLKYVWGDYSIGIDPNSLAAGKAEAARARPDIAKLRGVRLVFANESRAGLRLDEGLIKALTGGDTMTCRELYGKEFDFIPQYKLWLRTNNAPVFDGADTGMQRRIKKVPFDSVCEHKDPTLPEKLRQEADGILQWALAGLKDYQANGLIEPEIVRTATREYISSLDTIGLFVDECCEVRGNYEVQAKALYDHYREWIIARGSHPVAVQRFKEQLTGRGFTHSRLRTGARVWRGLRLYQSVETPVYADVVENTEEAVIY